MKSEKMIKDFNFEMTSSNRKYKKTPGFCIVYLCLFSLFPEISFAQSKKNQQVFTDPALAGEDFRIQGEYSGIISGGFRRRRIGMQVVAQGDGKFKVVVFQGGLPADGFDGKHKYENQGVIEKYSNGLQSVILSGNGWTGTLFGDEITVSDAREGTLRGFLKKVKRQSLTMGAAPPQGATVLFDGKSMEHFTNAKTTPQGWLMAGAITKLPVKDFRLHLEFRLPFKPTARGQTRGNSGVYIQRRYEVQVLDSFGLKGVFNECGGLYKQRAPSLNMCLPPLSWQTYDIKFRAARFDAAGKKVKNAIITVRHNGVTIHKDYELTNKTGGGKQEGTEPFPIQLQDHGNPVVYRNIWIVNKE